MGGESDTYFNVDGNITIAQTIVLACRLHSIYYTGEPIELSGDPWYYPYFEYAMENGIISQASESGLDLINQPAPRGVFASIIGEALPDEALQSINSIEIGAIPDVSLDDVYAFQIYRLYEAGVLLGNDTKGTFAPESAISRGAVAAIVSRMVVPSLRGQITLSKAPFEPVPLKQLANLNKVRSKASDDELAQAYTVALEIASQYAGLPLEDQLKGVTASIREYFDDGMEYSMESPHYDDPYGYFVLRKASCAGCVRATGMVLNILGIPYEHVNENQYSHQWVRVNVNGTYWICDAYGLYCGPEPEPYKHPYLS